MFSEINKNIYFSILGMLQICIFYLYFYNLNKFYKFKILPKKTIKFFKTSVKFNIIE